MEQNQTSDGDRRAVCLTGSTAWEVYRHDKDRLPSALTLTPFPSPRHLEQWETGPQVHSSNTDISTGSRQGFRHRHDWFDKEPPLYFTAEDFS